jgi:hypothetical protein
MACWFPDTDQFVFDAVSELSELFNMTLIFPASAPMNLKPKASFFDYVTAYLKG